MCYHFPNNPIIVNWLRKVLLDSSWHILENRLGCYICMVECESIKRVKFCLPEQVAVKCIFKHPSMA